MESVEANVLLSGLLVLIGCAAGLFAARGLRTAKNVRAPTRIPQHWPLDPRRMINSQERKVWHWLKQVFPEHEVMVKVAVTRFTLPRKGENSKQLYQVLNGVHCTFTVCGPDGRVLGCVDVPGAQGISRLHRQIKLTLLAQCGIVYRVIQPGSLPTAAEVRIEFLGEEALALFNRERAAVSHAQQELRATVERRRGHQRRSERTPRTAAAGAHEGDSGMSVYETEFGPSAWQQDNSFLAPLDSRLAGLQ